LSEAALGNDKKKRADPAKIRAALLADPNTKDLAEAVGLSLEVYIKQVIHFALNPNDEPMLLTIPDDDLASMGIVPLADDDMKQLLDEALSDADDGDADGRPTPDSTRKPPPRPPPPPQASPTAKSSDPRTKKPEFSKSGWGAVGPAGKGTTKK
jgi:hypothetical protein